MSSNSKVQPGWNRGPKIPVPLQITDRTHLLGNGAYRSYLENFSITREEIRHKKYCLPVVIKNLGKYSRMAVEKIFIKHRVVVCECFGEA